MSRFHGGLNLSCLLVELFYVKSSEKMKSFRRGWFTVSKLHTYEYKLIMDELIIGSQLIHIVCM